MTTRELPLPCNHSHKAWRYRIASHKDGEPQGNRNFCSVWVCGREDCIERGKRYIAYAALCTPLVIDGESREVVNV